MKKMFLLGVAVGAVLGLTGPFVQNAWAVSQPHMQAALHDLYAANNEIQLADQANDHGGYAAAATSAIQEAIGDVRQGIGYRNQH